MDADQVNASLTSQTTRLIAVSAAVLMSALIPLMQPLRALCKAEDRPEHSPQENGTAEVEARLRKGVEDSPLQQKTAEAASATRLDWWNREVLQSVTEAERWVSFDLETVLLDTLENSPRIASVSKRTSIALEQIVQQDAMFDPKVLFESRVGRNNEPIGNELTTGGPPRLIEGTTLARAGIQKNGRRGTEFDLSQEIGTFNSNSRFVSPVDQGNARLAISLTQPLLGRGDLVYNERFVTQARIDSRISWQAMRGEVEERISEVINAYWRLYELRCHLLQQTELLQRGESIQQVVLSRRDFDTGRVELAKTRQRIARRIDRLLQIEAAIARQQARLASLIGSDLLQGESAGLEFVTRDAPRFPELNINLADAVLKGIENRPEVRAAASDLESAGLAVNVSRAELDPELSGIVAGFVSGLDGNYRVFDAWTNQFTRGGPGISAAVTYEMPSGQRAAKARYREARFRYQQRNQQLREAMQLTTADIETALIDVNTAIAQQTTKKQVLVTAIEEENVLTRRWETLGDEGGLLGVILENLLDAQQRRTEAEREWSSAQVRYLTSIVGLQKAMGTLLIHEGIQPVRHGCHGIEFVRDSGMPDDVKDESLPGDGCDPEDHQSSSSPSGVIPAVEAEVDSVIEADGKPKRVRGVSERGVSDKKNGQARVQRLPVAVPDSSNGKQPGLPLIRLPGVHKQKTTGAVQHSQEWMPSRRSPEHDPKRLMKRLPPVSALAASALAASARAASARAVSAPADDGIQMSAPDAPSAALHPPILIRSDFQRIAGQNDEVAQLPPLFAPVSQPGTDFTRPNSETHGPRDFSHPRILPELELELQP